MTHLDTLISHIHQELEDHIDPDYLHKIKTLVPSEKTIIGVRVPNIRTLANAHHKDHPLDLDTTVALLDQLFRRQIRDEILYGIFLLEKHKRRYTSDLFALADRWVNHVENWEVCDQLGSRVTGEVVAKDLSLLAEMPAWAQSPNLWRRRSVLVIGVTLNQKGRSHVAETLQMTALLMNDPEPMVQKAIGWVLRETTKRDESQTFAFLMQWKGKAPRRVLRESAGKLPPELKAQLLD